MMKQRNAREEEKHHNQIGDGTRIFCCREGTTFAFTTNFLFSKNKTTYQTLSHTETYVEVGEIRQNRESNN